MNTLLEDQPEQITYDSLLAKYKDPEGIAKSVQHKESHIRTLESENQELRQYAEELRKDAQTKARLEELIDRLSTQQTKEDTTPSQPVAPTPHKPEELESVVASYLTKYEAKKAEDQNFNTVRNRLIEQYGTNYSTVVKEQTNNLGLSQSDIDSLARRSPAAFFRALGLEQNQPRQNFQAPIRSERTGTFAPQTEKKTRSYWQKQMKDPNFHTDPRQIEAMMQAAEELGADFEDGDFHTDKFLYKGRGAR
jgi:hypothetical protein